MNPQIIRLIIIPIIFKLKFFNFFYFLHLSLLMIITIIIFQNLIINLTLIIILCVNYEYPLIKNNQIYFLNKNIKLKG
jgi:hypothetical protein